MKLDKTITSQGRKQHARSAAAGLHEWRKLLAAPFSRELRKKLGKRGGGVTKGCKVKVLSGSFRNTSGKVTDCDSRDGTIAIENLIVRRQNGREKPIRVRANNVIILELRPESDNKGKKTEAKKQAQKTAEKKPETQGN